MIGDTAGAARSRRVFSRARGSTLRRPRCGEGDLGGAAGGRPQRAPVRALVDTPARGDRGDSADQGGPAEARETYRAIVRRDPRSWIAWAHLAEVTTGDERAHAIAVVHMLNPHYRSLPS